MTAARPWWASQGPVEGGVDPWQDPVEAHRAARRGPDRPHGAAHPSSEAGEQDPGHDGGAEEPTGRGGRRAGETTEAAADVCDVCPVCVSARVLAESRPELLGHLLEAGRHLSAALRTLLEAADAPPGSHGPDHDDAAHRPDRH